MDRMEVNIISLKLWKLTKKASGRYKDLNDLDKHNTFQNRFATGSEMRCKL